jgi:hypothetical protein
MAAPQSVTREEHFLVIFFYSTLGYGTYNPAPPVGSSGSRYPVPCGCSETNSGIRGNKKNLNHPRYGTRTTIFPKYGSKTNESIYILHSYFVAW